MNTLRQYAGRSASTAVSRPEIQPKSEDGVAKQLLAVWTIYVSGPLQCCIVLPRVACVAATIQEAQSHMRMKAVFSCPLLASFAGHSVERAEGESANVQSCNDGDFLEQRFFFIFTPRTADQICSFEDIAVCRAFKEKYSAYGQGQEPDWKSKELQSCTGPYADDLGADAFLVSTGENSDLYRYVLMYVIGWCVAVLTLIIFFYYVKKSSNFEAMFYQPPRRGDTILFRVVRPLTPWSR